MRRCRLSLPQFVGIMCMLIAGLGVGKAIGQTYQNFQCVPIAAPVTGCECPLGADHADRCEGTLPKSGNMYGDVACTAMPDYECESGSGMNPCGRVVMCPCITCGEPLIYLGCTCEVFDDKPPCINSWGSCAYQ